MNARERDLKRTLKTLAAEHGASVKISTTGGGHIRARFAVGAKKADVYMAATPTDWRAGRHSAAMVRRALRAAAEGAR
jgi:hypothetical protein